METPFFDPAESELISPLYNWVFHFNSFNNMWAAIPREHYQEYWNVSDHPSIIKSREITTLIDILYKIGGDPSKIEQLVKPQ
jgi:hypothetical protein